MRDNTAAFAELGFRPRVADLPRERSLATTVMGQDIAFPVVISPTGVQAVDPDGEVAVARAAAAADIAMGLSSFASKPIDQVVAANPKLFFQSYWVGDRDAMLARAERARAAGATGLILTLDWVVRLPPRLGQPVHPGEARPEGDGPLRPAGRRQARLPAALAAARGRCRISGCPTS